MAEIWENTPEPDSDFYQFMDSIAEKIVLDENWKGYRGEIGMLQARVLDCLVSLTPRLRKHWI